MFTGLVSCIGELIERTDDSLTIKLSGLDETTGASIAINGCCLTVAAEPADDIYRFDLLPATLQLTNLGDLQPGDTVNAEPALRAGQPLGGHIVQGHVDATATVTSLQPIGDAGAIELRIAIPPDLARDCIERGSLAVNGVSLTIASLAGTEAAFQLIPETQRATNLGALEPASSVNIEVDMLARYVRRMIDQVRE